MSVKVKIIAYNDGRRLMELVNDFCKGKNVIDIKFQSLLINESITRRSINDRVLIIYSEED